MYTVSLTNGMNGCGLSNFTPGDSSTNVGFTITQTGSAVSGTAEGLTGVGLDLWLGSHTFTGTVSGSHVDMTLHGNRAMTTSSGCAYTWDARVEGDLTGNALQGTITYSAAAAESAACSEIRMCRSVQTFVGSRPPQ
jgi:hypothetical protein